MRPLLLYLFIVILCPYGRAAEGIPLYNSLRESIVIVKGKALLNAPDGKTGLFATEGAGVILDKNGMIATNTHIIYGSQTISVTLPDGTTGPGVVVFVSPQHDLSIIKIKTDKPLLPVTWADSDLAQLDDDVITIGNSELLRSTISGGHIKSIGIRQNDPLKSPEFFELDINHYPGDSGGPVFTRKGEFLGLMNAKRLTQNRSCLVVPSNKIFFAYLSLAQPEQNR